MSKKINKILWILVGIIMLSGFFLLLFAKLDIGSDFVAREVQNAAITYLQADIRMGHVTGNPLRGYMILGTSLTKDGEEMLKADFVLARINLISLLSSPRLSLLSIGGVNMDLDGFAREFNMLTSGPSDRPFEMPVDELKLIQSRFFSEWGVIDVEDVGLRFSQNTFTARFKGHVNAVAVAGTLAAEINGTHAVLKNADLRVGRGSVKASGRLSEILDVQGTAEGIDAAELTSLWPALEPRDYAGTLSASFTMTGTWMDPVFSGITSYKGTRLAGLPVESIDGTVNYRQMRFSLDRLTASAFGIPLQGNVAMAFREAVPTVFVQLSGGAVNLAPLGDLWGVGGVTGIISDFETEIKGPSNALSGIISLNAPSIGAADMTCTNVALHIRLTGGNEAAVNGTMQFQGADSSVTGTVSELFSEPVLDLTLKTADLNAAMLKPILPDAENIDLNGTLTADIQIRGAAANPSIEGIIFGNSLAISGYTADDLTMGFSYAGGNFTLRDGSASWSGLPIRASGTVRNLPAANPVLDLSASLSMNPGVLGAYVPDIAQYNLRGIVQIGVQATGTWPEPQIDLFASSDELAAMDMISARNIRATTAFSGDFANMNNMEVNVTSAALSVAGFGMDDLNMELSGNFASLNLNSLSARIGEGMLFASGNLNPMGGAGQIDFTGSGLDLARLTENIPELSGQIAGTLSARFSTEFSRNGASGQGDASSPSIEISGIRFADVSLPLTLDGENFIFGQGTAGLHGGILSGGGSINTRTMTYSGRLNASGVDVNALTHSMIPDLEGNITGYGALDLSFGGTAGSGFTLGGTGQATVGSGGLSGFRWLDLISRLYGVNSVRYTQVTAPFRLETTRLVLERGSAAFAPEGDPLYRYVRVEGPITYAGDLNLTGEGNVNFQLVNAAAGGVWGAVGAASGGNIGAIVSGILDGGAGASGQADFRDVSFRIAGNADRPSFSILNAGPSNLPASLPTGSDPRTIEDTINEIIQDNITIPSGTSEQRPATGADQPQRDIIREEAGNLLRDLIRRR